MRLMPFLAAAGCGSSDATRTGWQAGTIDYACTIHPGQTGAITVTG
ncbi:MAG: hypothetical protein ACJ76K_05665 [Solirubrobacteraceae bacterium]|jgi:plastocyanin